MSIPTGGTPEEERAGFLVPGHDAADSLIPEACTTRHEVDLSWLDGERHDDWALTTAALQFTARLVQLMVPGAVVELGSGRSTRVLARTARGMATPPLLTTLENDPELMGRTAAALVEDGTRELVDLRFAPVVVRRCRGRQVPVYLLGAGARPGPGPAEIILVDGPPMPMGGREGALYQAVEFATAGAVILLDDAHRDSEARALEHLAAVLGEIVSIRLLDGFDKGLAVVRVRERTSMPMAVDQGPA